MADVKINTQTHQFDRVYQIPKEQLANALRAIPHNGADDYVFKIDDQFYIASRRGDSIPLSGEGVIRFRTTSHDAQSDAHTAVTIDSILSESKRADGVVKYQGKTGFMVAVDDEVNTKAEGRAQTPTFMLVPGLAGGGLVGLFTGAGAYALAERILPKAAERVHSGIGLGVAAATVAAGGAAVFIDKYMQGKKAETKTVDLEMLEPFANKIDQ